MPFLSHGNYIFTVNEQKLRNVRFTFFMVIAKLHFKKSVQDNIVWKVSKHGVFCSPYFPVFVYEIRENTEQKKLRIWTLFTQCNFKALRKSDLNMRLFFSEKYRKIFKLFIYFYNLPIRKRSFFMDIFDTVTYSRLHDLSLSSLNAKETVLGLQLY